MSMKYDDRVWAGPPIVAFLSDLVNRMLFPICWHDLLHSGYIQKTWRLLPASLWGFRTS